MEAGRTDNFVQKTKIATEKMYLPYMEMKSSLDKNSEKENAEPPGRIAAQPKKNKEEGRGLSLQLGEEYERKKQRLKAELRLDYRRYVAERHFRAGEAHALPQSLSLSIREKRSEKAVGEDPLSPIVPSLPHASAQHRNRSDSPGPERALTSGREAGTGAEPVSRAGPRMPRRCREGRGRRTGRRAEQYSSEEDLDSEEQEEFEILHRRRDRLRQEPPHAGERRRARKTHHRTNRAAQGSRQAEAPPVNEVCEESRGTQLTACKANPQAPPPTQARAASRKNMGDFATGLIIGTAEEEEEVQKRKERYRHELLEQMAEQRKNKRKEKELELRVAATGATDPEKQPDRIKQFGAVRREYEGKRRDVPYRSGLDRRPQEEVPLLGPVEREPPQRPRLAFQSPILEYSAALGHTGGTVEAELGVGPGGGARAGIGGSGTSLFAEDFHKSLSGTLGEMVAPRVAGPLPPRAPSLSETFNTPYDEAYYYYGARNPLDPNLAYYGPPAGVVQSVPDLSTHSSILQPPAEVLEQSASHHGVVQSGPFPTGHQQTHTGALSYKEALKQQIEERQERRRREREDLVRYDAKLEAEMKAYEPWGRGGGGAPLRDDRGNLISDLKRMHRTNEEAYRNPESRHRGTDRFGAGDGLRSRTGNKDPSSHRVSGFSFSQPSPHARGNVFIEIPTPQQLCEQEKYKESLKLQIEEKRKMEAEKREKLRVEEEREEQRLAEQRVRIQQEYEEEQEKKKRKEMEQTAKNQEMVRQAEERRRESERKKREEEERENEAVREQYEQERQARLEQDCRSESPPIPAVQKRLGFQRPSADRRPSAAASSAFSLSPPGSPPVPARRNQIRATEQQGVISELSELRRRLRSEQRRVEGQFLQPNREDTQSPLTSREPPLLDVFDMARLRMQVSARRPPSNRTAHRHNIQDFNQLKDRDSESREEVRQTYPEPPSDDTGLEIQQQALLREQQRRLTTLRTAKANDYFDLSSPMKAAQLTRAEGADGRAPLQSESAFIDPSGYTFLTSPPTNRRARLSSARERRRLAHRPDEGDACVESSTREDSRPSPASVSSLDDLRQRNQRRLQALEDMSEPGWRSGDTSADEGDDLWQQTPSPPPARRVSTATVATEPWLRPGTTETLKRLMAGRGTPSRNPLHDGWEGPSSTYHG